MEALEQRGNVAEALHAYERLRVLLREELGITPSPTVQAVHRVILIAIAASRSICWDFTRRLGERKEHGNKPVFGGVRTDK